ncbi:MoaB/Mog domain-containing protein [Cladochytrium replicatum]|nr:MoaB/Mog domain-containing protein [Cladochytrium replicatum]
MASKEKAASPTIACLIIGDEILNGRVQDSNTQYLAQKCFQKGISLSRVVVVPDIEADIIEEVRLLSNRYTYVFTSGGIGPTHDDITYESIAKAFDLDLKHHEPTLSRMRTIGYTQWLKQKQKSGGPDSSKEDTSVEAYMNEPRKRMALLPANRDGMDDSGAPDGSRRTRVWFPSPLLWVPVVVANGNTFIFPGVPRLFQELLDLTFDTLFPSPSPSPTLSHTDPQAASASSRTPGFVRTEIKTQMAESDIADALRTIADQYAQYGIKVGSYPVFTEKPASPSEDGGHYKGIRMDYVIISVVGKDAEKVAEASELVREKINGVILPPDDSKK